MYFKFYGYFASAQYDKLSCFLQKAQNNKVRCHCEQILQKFAWQSTIKFKQTLPQNFKQNLKFCHTERSEVSINVKCDFSALRYILNSMDFSSFAKAQNDTILVRVGAKAALFLAFLCFLYHTDTARFARQKAQP